MNTKQSNPKDIVGTKKTPLSTVPTPVIAEVGVAMLEGALKYGRHNYRAVGVRASVYYDATMRHLMLWWEGEDLDPDSGMSHITKAITSLVVLRDTMINGNWEDDRPPSSEEFMKRLNDASAALVEKYKDVKPHHYTIGDQRAEVGDLAKELEEPLTYDHVEGEIQYKLEWDYDGWLENEGKMPDCDRVTVKLRCGMIIENQKPISFSWGLSSLQGGITEYKVVK